MSDIIFRSCRYDDIKDAFPVGKKLSVVDTDNLVCFYAATTSQLLGLCVVEPCPFKNTVVLGFIYVVPTARRKGIGRQLLNNICRWNNGKYGSCEIFLNNPEEHISLDCFLRSFHNMKVRKDCTEFLMDSGTWLNNVMPMVNTWSASVGELHYKLKSAMTILELGDLDKVAVSENISESLRHCIFDCGEGDGLVFYKADGHLVGWVTFFQKGNSILELDCTFILHQYRNAHYVFAIWRVVTNFISSEWKHIKKLSFYYDTENVSLGKFYRWLTRYTDSKCLNRYKYELPLVQTT